MNVTQHYPDTLTLMDTASRARHVTVNATIMMEDTIVHAVKDILHHLLAPTSGNVTVSITKPYYRKSANNASGNDRACSETRIIKA